MNFMLAAAPLALLAAVPRGEASLPAETTPPAAPLASSGLTYQDLLLTEQEDVQGCVLRIGTHLIELEDVVFGADEKGCLMVAYAQGKNLEGEYVHHDRLEHAVLLFETIDDVTGVFVHAGDDTVWAEKVVFGRLPGGELSTLSFQGFREFGADSEEHVRDAIPLCLTATSSVECVPDGCGGNHTCLDPTTEDDGKITCMCSSGFETCEPKYTQVCPSNGLCPVGKSCKNKPSDPSKCECR